jgi:leucyl aminopeptidase
MSNCYTFATQQHIKQIATPIHLFTTDQFNHWLTKQDKATKTWCNAMTFTAKPETTCLIPSKEGSLHAVVVGINSIEDMWNVGNLSSTLPFGNYYLDGITDASILQRSALAWALGAYIFSRYKTDKQPAKKIAVLCLPKEYERPDQTALNETIKSIYLIRDLINTPTEDMSPAELAGAAVALGKEFKAKVTQIIGDELLRHQYPTIHTVGRASTRPPRLIDLQWGKATHPKLTLIGKGVCFDSGGLDLKPSSAMALMKKDMGGAAHVLGLARLIMATRLPVRLRVLIPAVENVISGNAYRPGDVIVTRSGKSVEVNNTDAEGRLILSDALTEAVSESPDLVIDITTLTGAARIALGTDVPVFFTPQDTIADELSRSSATTQDPIWRLPLYKPYRKLLDSTIADISNASNSPYGGAITAALFLKEFIPDTIPWIHFDLMAWNIGNRPGRPDGGEAMSIRAIFSYLQNRFLSL